MASSFNLIRNSRVFFSSNVNATTGALPTSGASITAANTKELQVLDGFSFSQGTQQTTIQITEAGNVPSRGQRSFNVSLDPVEFTFSMYMRPDGASTITAEESVLWNALFSASNLDLTGAAITATQLSRASTTTNVATMTMTSANFNTVHASGAIIAGDVVSLAFPSTLTNYQEWAGPVRIVSFSPSATACTSLVVEYLTAPSVAAGATATGAITATKIYKGAWAPHSTAVASPAYSQVHTGDSNRNQLLKFGLYFSVDNALYAVDNCAMDQASVDFGLDGIATIAWTGKATALRYLPSATVSTAGVFSGSGNATGTAAPKNTAANYITNKLSTMTLVSKIMGNDGTVGTSYAVPITGGNLTISNNINYIVPANLGVVNQPIGYFTGSRSVSGNITAYLRTGSGNSAQVLSDILTANASETKFKVQIEVGGSSNPVHIDFKMNGCVLQVPTVESADVMSTTINFTAQGYDPIAGNQTYDLQNTNDLYISYFNA